MAASHVLNPNSVLWTTRSLSRHHHDCDEQVCTNQNNGKPNPELVQSQKDHPHRDQCQAEKSQEKGRVVDFESFAAHGWRRGKEEGGGNFTEKSH